MVEIDAATWRKEECSRGCASDADGAAGTTETDRRAKELGAAMLNAARPYMDVKLDKMGIRLQLRHAISLPSFVNVTLVPFLVLGVR